MRPAVLQDQDSIRSLIRQVRINPIGLGWRRFVIASDRTGRLVGCGQIKPHRDGSYELASIAVAPECRGQGVARAIIERLLEDHQHARGGEPLYLTCRPGVGPLYERFGFQRVSEAERLPSYFHTVRLLARLIHATGLIPKDLWIMKRT